MSFDPLSLLVDEGNPPEQVMAKPLHYMGDYHVRSQQVRAAANANPATRCWRCQGLALPDDPWEAGHVQDATPGGLLLPEHRSCNRRAAAYKTNHQHVNSRDW